MVKHQSRDPKEKSSDGQIQPWYRKENITGAKCPLFYCHEIILTKTEIIGNEGD